LIAAAVFLIAGCSGRRDQTAGTPAVNATYAGLTACVDCHTREYALWNASDHARAMAVPTDSTVLGDFDGATFSQHGITSRFTKTADGFFVRTEGEDGKLHDYRVKYVFGFRPLQQYLVEFPGGKLQTLPLCWDARPREAGGQRWYHIYGDERIAPNDILFWTRIAQNWNYMCAECHSTNLLKNYDAKEGKYNTTWTDIAVACEACHGPGSEHVEWANAKGATGGPAAGAGAMGGAAVMGLTVSLKDPVRGTWTMDPATGNSKRTPPLKSDVLLETCARCHVRRTQLREPYSPGRPLAGTHLPSLLDDPLYYPDGQIEDEVYEYASFKQSRMYANGVTCTDCHDVHSMKAYATDNSLCARCHSPRKFDSRAHHFHDPGKAGASCVGCHMPTRTYMGVDARRDHSIRVPRPELTGRFGVPNACASCHKEKSAKWVGDSFAKWYGRKGADTLHYARALQAGREGSPDAPALLAALSGDRAAPAIVRATALSMMQRYPGAGTAAAVRSGILDADPLVRLGAAQGLPALPPEERFSAARPLLGDTLLAVRVEATRTLLDVALSSLTADGRSVMERALAEYRSVQEFNADHPSAHMNLGNLALRNQDFVAAEAEYKKAIELESAFTLTYVNLADLYRLRGEEEKGERVLNEALKMNPDFAGAHYALGLLMVRQKRVGEGLAHLKRASILRPDEAGYAYTYAIGLNSTGDAARAVSALEDALKIHPYNRDILVALATIQRDRGKRAEALRYAETLMRLWPQDQSYKRLYQDLSGGPGR
jgi:tetratricopeptide (TPR) repeat protein